MTATRTATEHKRRAYSPIVNAVQLTALRWLAERGPERRQFGWYWQKWYSRDVVNGLFQLAQLRVAETTLRALEHRGLIECYDTKYYSMVRITDAGRECLRKAKQ